MSLVSKRHVAVLKQLNVENHLLKAGVEITPTAAELNTLDGITASVTELNYLDGSTPGTAVASKAAVLGANKELDEVHAEALYIGAGAGTQVTATAAEINKVAGVTGGTATASKAAVLGANKELDEVHAEALYLGAGAGTLVSADASEINKLDGATVTTAQINSIGHHPGARAVGIIRIAANVADTETVTIGADVYEFDRAADGIAGGSTIAVTGHADDTPANATNALITAINASGTEAITAIDIGDNEILLVADAVGAVVTALAETMAGVDNVVDTAAMRGGAAAAIKQVAAITRVPNATEVALGNLHVALPFDPTVVIVQVRVTASGAPVAWNGAVTITAAAGGAPAYVTLDNSSTTDWSANDTIHLVAYE